MASVATEYGAFEDAAVEEPMEETEETAVQGESASGETVAGLEQSELVVSDRKLIRRVDMNVETREFTDLVHGIEQKVTELGGYMETSEIYGGGHSYDPLKRASFTMRVPVDELDSMVNAVSSSRQRTLKQ